MLLLSLDYHQERGNHMSECIVPVYTIGNNGQFVKVEYVTEDTNKRIFDDATQAHINTQIENLRQLVGKRHVSNLDQQFLRLYPEMIDQYGYYPDICVSATIEQMQTELLV